MDRDGVIIEDVGYLNECSGIKFLPRASEAIKLLNKNGFKVIVVTNQSGVARGYFTEETVQEINRSICELLAKQGAFIDKIYYCPHHAEGTVSRYVKDCYCRKPSPGTPARHRPELTLSATALHYIYAPSHLIHIHLPDFNNHPNG